MAMNSDGGRYCEGEVTSGLPESGRSHLASILAVLCFITCGTRCPLPGSTAMGGDPPFQPRFRSGATDMPRMQIRYAQKQH